MAITFQDTILRLQEFWAGRGALVWQPINTEVGAGTMNPATFLRVLGPEPWHVAYVEPSVRPDDSRYGENPNRIQTHTQFQVILKPGPDDPQQVYLDSLAAIGIDTAREDIRFVEDNWQQPALGAWGLGWEVWLDGLEITQFTYFQQAGGIALDPVAVEITYGLERIVMSQQGARRFQDIEYAPGITYGDALGRSEYEWSVYYLDQADVDRTRQLFALHEQEARALIGANLALPAYGQLLRTSHLFNVLDARGAVGVAERAAYFARMRELARTISELWLGTEPPPRPAPNPPAPREQAALPPVEGARELLLELGVEELPPADLDAALRHLRTAAPAELERRRLEADAIEVHGTPRRIVLTAAGLRTGAAELVRGPAWHVAFGEDGTPSKAGEGFARKHGIAASELVQVEHGGQVFAGATASQGADVRTAAADAAEALLNGIPYARGMRWNESQVLFARPARWIAALLGDDVLPVRFAGLTAGRTTRALRGTEPVELATAADHAPALAAAGIVLDETEREARIAARAGELAAEAGGGLAVAPGDPLMGEVTNLVEAPTPLLGSIDAEFVELPDPVLATVMRRHQRYLPIERDGALLPAFVVVANGEIDAGGVRAGNEAVLRARFADARFFIAQDEQRSLEDFRADLDGIVFEEKLGSMLEKSRRQERLTAELAPLLLAGEEQRATAIRAAALGRADLATQMVTEMTSLAGTMGGIYARAQGLPEDVAAAIEEHVRPAYAGDRLPRTDAGAVAGLADRIDSLTGLMAAGHSEICSW